MRNASILAIDAAWTPTAPSGVALVVQQDEAWRCVAVAPTYNEFIAQSQGGETNWSCKGFRGSKADVPLLLRAAQRLARTTIDVVALDMPVAIQPFSGRRAADDAISAEFGSRWCSAHSPTDARPGRLGMELSVAFERAGYPLATTDEVTIPCLIEVYPHPALLSLLKRSRRVPYKVSRSQRYWPKVTISARIAALLDEYSAIHAAVSKIFGPIGVVLPVADEVHTLSQLKRIEDALDALICAWVGVEYLAGRAIPLGDETAAIWCPRDVVLSAARAGKA